MVVTVLQVLYAVVLIALGVILVWRYVRTRNIGFIVLGVALPLWPLLLWGPTVFVRKQIDLLLSGQKATFPFSLLDGRMGVGEIVSTFNYSSKFLQMCLILLGFILLSRSTGSFEPPNSTLQPAGAAGG